MPQRILLHTCCGPCTLYPLRRLRGEGFLVHGLFHNPNIHPFQEFERRVEAMKAVARIEGLPMIMREDYDIASWLRAVAFREAQRCVFCVATRLEAAARIAARGRFDAFTTTLLFSRHQRHEEVRRLWEAAGYSAGVRFHHEDFREGRHEGRALALELGLYRQQYCGCVYSEAERFMPRARPLPPREPR